jgi:hypothetical protein
VELASLSTKISDWPPAEPHRQGSQIKEMNSSINQRAFLCVVTRNYAHYAKVALESAKKFHPEADCFVCYVDEPPREFLAQPAENFSILGKDLGIDNWSRYSFQYTPFELACALKPHAAKFLLDRGYQEIIYIDGDMELFGPLTEVVEALKTHSIVLTPHLLKPLPLDGCRPDESAFLYSGAYNAGFFSIRKDANSLAFLEWWQQMVRKHCIIDMAGALFVDQKWLGLAPSLFDGVKLLKHPGYNAGHWSLSQFQFAAAPRSDVSQSGVSVDGQPLVLFHYSGMTPDKPDEYLGSQTRLHLDQIPPLQRLVRLNHAALERAGRSECAAWGCQFDRLEDGTEIHPAWREAIRRDYELFKQLAEPYLCSRHPHQLESLKSIEKRAVIWRRDWMLKWPKQKGVKGQVRETTHKIRDFLRKFRPRRKAA